jgi:hypothetical protein
MRSIINVSQPQMGKTTHTLRETETCIEFINLNMVFEYNITVEDVLHKAKDYSFSCERIDKRLAQKIRKQLVLNQDPELPTMLCGIMDVYRGDWLEGMLMWAKHRGQPVRMIVDEYDVFGIGHTHRDGYAARDEWLKMIMDEQLIDLMEFNSATNISGVISDYHWEEVNRIKPYDGYCGWETVQLEVLDASHFQDLLNGVLTPQLQRKLARAYESHENILLNLNDRTEAHETIARTVDFGCYQNIKQINYTSDDTLVDVDEQNTLIVGGQKFGRSVSIPNLTTMFYYRNALPNIANILQAAGRVLGPRKFNPIICTTPELARSIEQGYQLEQKIIDEEILYETPEARVRWLNEQVQNLDSVRLFTDKSNGYRETMRAEYQVVEDVTGFHKFDHWYEIDMPIDLWNNWEIKSDNRRTSQAMLKICESLYPHIKTIKGVRDESDGANAANRRYIAIKENLENGYNRYVNSKHSKRKLPILYGRQRGRPGKGFLIIRDPDIEYSEQCWHHNEYGEKIRLVQKSVTRD